MGVIAIAGFASAVNVLKASVEAITRLTGREEERSEARDLSATVPRNSAPGAPRLGERAYGAAAAQLYRKGDAAGLAALAKAASDPDEGLALEWASLRSDAHLSVAALTSFAEAHPGWPDGGWIRRRREAQLFSNSEAAAKVAAYFASEPPLTSVGMIAAARAANATGRFDEGARIIRALWRDGDFDHSTGTYRRRARTADPGAPHGGPAGSQERSGTPIRSHSGRPALESRLRGGGAARAGAARSHGLDQLRPLVERTAEGRRRTARSRRAAPRVRTLRQRGQTRPFRQPERRRLPCRLDRVAVPRRRSRCSTAVRAGC